METMEAVVEQPVVETQGDGGREEQQQQVSQQDQQRQADKEYSNWIKSLKEDGEAGKHFKRI